MRTVKGAAGLGVNVRLALAGLHNGSQGSRPCLALPSPGGSHNRSFPAVSACLLFTLHHFYFLLPRPTSPPAMCARCQALALLIPEPCMWLKYEAGSAAKPQDCNGALAEENRPLFWVLEVDAGR